MGSLDVNGTLRPLIEERGWNYTGLDLVEGPNVDVKADFPFYWQMFDYHSFDLVISNACLEHVEKPHFWFEEIGRVLKTNGLCIIQTPWSMTEHEPTDYWRVLPAGMRSLMAHYACLTVIEADKDEVYTWGVATASGLLGI